MMIETSISMDDILNNSFEVSVNTKNLLFSRCMVSIKHSVEDFVRTKKLMYIIFYFQI